ncbi:restriction endonuclease subunit S [Vibrio neptunius]|uniref:restriction endonuclease subunit S n=1 Tax=Vibrio neptunius TaxID=170651 RepID=UPI0019D1B7B2|nr:restriction endonuclease subunit S [Vibrio neptunius]MBN3573785.1 restriction endonuclease subunit S [Vibrio neptunius]
MSSVVPDGWQLKTVGELSDVRRGASPRPIKDPKWWGGNVGWVRISDVTSSSKYLKKTTQYLSDEGVSKSVKINRGEVVLSICATIGRPIIIDVDACVHDGFVWFSRLAEFIDREYWYYFLSSKEEFLASQRQSGTQGNLNTSIVSDLLCLLPPHPEQKKIAAILSSVDEVIEKTQAQIDKLKALKTGMMQELLTRGVGVDGKPHTEFKDSPIGRIPKGWSVAKLSEIIGSMEGGVSVNGENRSKTHQEIGVLKVSSVFKGRFIPEEHKAVVKEDELRARVNPVEGKILFSRANTPDLVGESGYVESSISDLFLPDKLWMISAKNESKTNMRWLSYVLSSGRTRKLISDAATGTSGSMKNISKPNLLSIEVAVPCPSEQFEIAKVIRAIDVRIEKRSQQLIQKRAIKKALMQDLLTGKVRVKVDS